MAILKVYNELDEQGWFQELMKREFDEIELLTTTEREVKIYRIQGEEIPKEDKQISFRAIQLAKGIAPIIIGFD